MGFYGNVYFQLIEAFHKFVLKNSGDKTYSFNKNKVNPSGTQPEDIIESPAKSRKGVFSLDSGNAWINFSKESTTDSESYKIWHSEPAIENSTKKPIFKLQLDAAELEKRKDGNIIQLEDHDIFTASESEYDAAGHIIGTANQIYRLPKAQVNEEVDKLKQLVGEPEGKDLPEVEEEKANLYGYTEHNSINIETLQKYVGNWDEVINADDNYSSISNVIGNINALLGKNTYDWVNEEELKSLTDVIGNMAKLWKEYDGDLMDKQYSLSETILDFKDRYDDKITSIDSQIVLLNNAVGNIGQRGPEQGQLYTEIDNLYDKYNELKELHITDKANLDSRDADFQGNINTINESLRTMNDSIEAHGQAWSGTKKELEDQIISLGTDVNDLEKDIISTFNQQDGKIETKADSATVESLKNSLEQKDKELSDAIGKAQADANAYTDSKIGTPVEGKTAVEMINETNTLVTAATTNISTINAFLSKLGTGDSIIIEEGETILASISRQLSNLQASIDDIKEQIKLYHPEGEIPTPEE